MSNLLKALEGLNPEQAQVVAHQDGPLLVASVAGSGKTHAVTVRMGRLVADGVRPERILAVAFGKKAAEEMTVRAQRYANSKQMRVGTFHSVAFELVRRERPALETWTIDEGKLYRFCLKDLVGFKGGPNIPGMKWKEADLSFLEEWISFAKNSLALPGSDKAVELAKRAAVSRPGKSSNPQKVLEAYELAEHLRTERQILTFDDMLVEAAMLLRDEAVRLRWASRFDYLIQDEAQDQCYAMMEIAEALARDHRNYMMVGDTNQTIYSWRGADPTKFLSFETDWNAMVIKMVRNYRSGSEIINAANHVIGAMNPATRMDMTMRAERTHLGEIASLLYEDFDDEADEVSRKILQLHADGVPWADMTVLYRVNAQSRAPEEALLSKRVPYRILGGTNFYERREVKDLLAYFRAAIGARLTDVSRCINSPSRFLGKKFLERVEARATALKTAGGPIDWVSLMSAVCDETGVHAGQRASAQEWAKIIHRLRAAIDLGGIESKPSRLLDKLVLETGYTQWLVQEEGQESTENNRVSNVRELVRAADRFATVAELLKYIDLTIESSKRNNNSQPNAVTLMSLHRCVHPDTLVETSEGLLPIREIAMTGQVATAVGPLPYTAKAAYPEREMLTLRTSNGYEITVTPDHGLMVWDGTAYVRRTAENLRVGDFLRLHLGVVLEPKSAASLPLRPLSDVRTVCHSTPSSITPELAEFLGLFVADGTAYVRGFRLITRHADVRDRFAYLAETLFGCKVKRFDKPQRSGNPGRVYTAEVNSTELSAWLYAIGGLSPREKAVPPCILRSNSALQAAFLRGLFEDGTVNLRTASVVDHVAWHTSYEAMGRHVQTILLRLGMISTRFPTNGGWRVALYGTYAHTFRDRVGFIATFKQDRLHLAVGSDTRNLVPVDPEWVRNNISHTAHRFDRQNAIMRGYVSRLVARRWGLVDTLQWHHDSIASITQTTGPSLCVEVPQHGRFLQSGFDGSNSKGLEYPVVFLLGCNEMVLPHARGDLDEERRLFYVGVTRAKDLLYVSAVRKAATSKGLQDLASSRFLSEAHLEPQEPKRTPSTAQATPMMVEAEDVYDF